MKDLLLNANALNVNNANNAINVNNTNITNVLNRNLNDLSIDDDDQEDVYIQDEPDFGIMFDIDGVLARGTEPLQAAVDAFKLLTDDNNQLRVPVAFVTNACNRSADKAAQIQSWLGIEVLPSMVVHSPTPLKIMEDLHDKHILLVGQGPVRDVANELGFKNYCLLEEITDAYPLLDMVDHKHRSALAHGYVEKDFPPVEAIILLGEPINWESYLQVIIDLLLTGGQPNRTISPNTQIEQIPVIACNMDLTFMHKANMPRFGHGAFLVCLEALYKKITGNEMQYSRLVGKPCEIQYRYGEHVVNTVREKLGFTTPIKKLYFVGDNPNVDVMGANMYNNYLKSKYSRRQSVPAIPLPASRVLPINDNLTEQTATTMYSLLVSTGVYKPETLDTTTDTACSTTTTDNSSQKSVYHGHRDIERKPSLTIPTKFCEDVYEAVEFVMQSEGMLGMYS